MVGGLRRRRYLWLGVSSSPSVTFRSDGWLFFVDDGGLEDFTNQAPLTEPEIQNRRDVVVRAQRWCRARGIAYAFTVLPDKGSIYPELSSDCSTGQPPVAHRS